MNTTGKRKGKSRAWHDRQNNDQFVKQARAAFKLEEIDKKYRLIKPGMRIIDLGAAPGSWCEYAAKKINGKGKIVAIDLLDFDPVEGVDSVIGDFTEPHVIDAVKQLVDKQVFDLVLSDMAPNITGVAMQDQARYQRLLLCVVEFCQTSLRPGGNLLTKFFEGRSTQQIRQLLRAQFQTLKVIKPQASRSQSKESYLLALNRK